MGVFGVRGLDTETRIEKRSEAWKLAFQSGLYDVV